MKTVIYFTIGFVIGVFAITMSYKFIIDSKKPIIIEEKTPIQYERLGEYTVSFYNLNKNRTAQGTEVREGHTVACDTSIIPANSYIYIKDWGIRQCVDTGLNIKGNKIDIYLNKSTKELKELGLQKKEVFLIKDSNI